MNAKKVVYQPCNPPCGMCGKRITTLTPGAEYELIKFQEGRKPELNWVQIRIKAGLIGTSRIYNAKHFKEVV